MLNNVVLSQFPFDDAKVQQFLEPKKFLIDFN